MATALATPLSDNGHQVRLVGTHLDRDITDSIKQTGIHPNLGLRVPEGTTAYQLEEAQEAFADAERFPASRPCTCRRSSSRTTSPPPTPQR